MDDDLKMGGFAHNRFEWFTTVASAEIMAPNTSSFFSLSNLIPIK